jgi:hypothetical protein
MLSTDLRQLLLILLTNRKNIMKLKQSTRAFDELYWNPNSIKIRAHRAFPLLLEVRKVEKIKWLIDDMAKELEIEASHIIKVINQIK